MSITVNLYNNADDKRTVDKSLTALRTVTANLYDECDILHPVLRCAWVTGMTSYNYMYIPEFGRYYYIEITAAPGGAAIIKGSVDVLMSHAAAIKAMAAVLVRRSSRTNTGSQKSTWIPDNKLVLSSGRVLKAIPFENTDLNIDTATATSNNFVLNVAGGGAIST